MASSSGSQTQLFPPIADATTFPSPFNTPVPLLFGLCSVQAIPFYTSPVTGTGPGQKQSDGSTGYPEQTMSFAVLVGKPDPQASAIQFTNVYFDGATYPNAAIRYYYGTEDQEPDPLIANAFGFGVGLRGLCYIVVENYLLPNGSTNIPQVVVEVSQTYNDAVPVFNVPAGPSAPYYAAKYDPSTKTILRMGQTGYDVFSTLTAMLLYNRPYQNMAADPGICPANTVDNTSHNVAFSPDGTRYFIGQSIYHMQYLDLASNTVLATLPNNYTRAAAASNGPVGKYDFVFVYGWEINDSHGLQIMGIAGTNYTRINANRTDLPNGEGEGDCDQIVFAPTPAPTGSEGLYAVFYAIHGSTVNGSELWRYIVSAAPGTVYINRTMEYIPPNPGGPLIQPQYFQMIGKTISTVDAMKIDTVPVGASITGLMVGPASDPTVQYTYLIPSGPNAGTYLKMFYTPWTIPGGYGTYVPTDGTTSVRYTPTQYENYDAITFPDGTGTQYAFGGQLNGPGGPGHRIFDYPNVTSDPAPKIGQAISQFYQPTDDQWSYGSPDAREDALAYNFFVIQPFGLTGWIFNSLPPVNQQTFATAGFFDVVSKMPCASPLNASSVIDITDGIVYQQDNPAWCYLLDANGDGSLKLSQYLTSLCLLAGFTIDEIDTSAIADDVVFFGSCINQSVNLTDILDALVGTYDFDYFDGPGIIKFVRKIRSDGLIFDAELVEETDLMPMGQASQDDTHCQFDRAYVEDLPAKLTFEYIDNIAQLVGTQTAKRTSYPVKSSSSDQTVDLSVPIVMTTAAAIKWANAALFQAWERATKITFRLPQSGYVTEPSDFIQLTRSTGEVFPFRVSKTTLNADLSLSVEGYSLVKYNNFDDDLNTTALYTIVANTAAKPLLCLLENVLFQPSDLGRDTAGASNIPYRWLANENAALYVARDTTGVLLYAGATSQPALFGSLVAQAPTTGTPSKPINETDETGTLSVIFPSLATTPPPPAPIVASDEDYYNGLYFAFVGAPGRWEMFYFGKLAIGAHGVATFSRLRRGRRGTEWCAAQLQVGDAIVFPGVAFGYTIVSALVGQWTDVRGMPAVAATNTSFATIASEYVGGPVMPWQPSQLACEGDLGADVTMSWNRRTYLETFLHDGDGDVPLEFPSESYTVSIVDTATATTLRTVTIAAATSWTYTAAMQTADGVVYPFTLAVAQNSPIVGKGWTAYAVFAGGS